MASLLCSFVSRQATYLSPAKWPPYRFSFVWNNWMAYGRAIVCNVSFLLSSVLHATNIGVAFHAVVEREAADPRGVGYRLLSECDLASQMVQPAGEAHPELLAAWSSLFLFGFWDVRISDLNLVYRFFYLLYSAATSKRARCVSTLVLTLPNYALHFNLSKFDLFLFISLVEWSMGVLLLLSSCFRFIKVYMEGRLQYFAVQNYRFLYTVYVLGEFIQYILHKVPVWLRGRNLYVL